MDNKHLQTQRHESDAVLAFLQGLGGALGVIAGLGVGAMISSNKKNNLMDKYNVKEVTKN